MSLKDLFRIPGLKTEESRSTKLARDLLRHEAKIGGELFGPVPPGGKREFFCLDTHTWIWHEEWRDNKNNLQSRTTRYDVRPTGIVKTVDGKHYQKLTKEESARLRKAAELYEQRVNNEIYNPILQA